MKRKYQETVSSPSLTELPSELLLVIFQYAGVQSLSRAKSIQVVCKTFKNVTRDVIARHGLHIDNYTESRQLLDLSLFPLISTLHLSFARGDNASGYFYDDDENFVVEDLPSAVFLKLERIKSLTVDSFSRVEISAYFFKGLLERFRNLKKLKFTGNLWIQESDIPLQIKPFNLTNLDIDVEYFPIIQIWDVTDPKKNSVYVPVQNFPHVSLAAVIAKPILYSFFPDLENVCIDVHVKFLIFQQFKIEDDTGRYYQMGPVHKLLQNYQSMVSQRRGKFLNVKISLSSK